MKRALVVLVLCFALALAACLPVSPPAAFPKGFDTCATPPASTMSAWWGTSPYTSFGVYIGGENLACAQPNLNATWTHSVAQQGWKLMPLWVGPQPSCGLIANTSTFSNDLDSAWWTGVSEGLKATDAAANLDLKWLAPIYYDMEPYIQGGACGAAAQKFMSAWTFTLHYRGYRAGLYGNLCFGLGDSAAKYSDPTSYPVDAIWIAKWDNTPNLFGFGPPCPLSDAVWPDHQRAHQYVGGGHVELWGGKPIDIDVNVVDAPTATP